MEDDSVDMGYLVTLCMARVSGGAGGPPCRHHRPPLVAVPLHVAGLGLTRRPPLQRNPTVRSSLTRAREP